MLARVTHSEIVSTTLIKPYIVISQINYLLFCMLIFVTCATRMFQTKKSSLPFASVSSLSSIAHHPEKEGENVEKVYTKIPFMLCNATLF